MYDIPYHKENNPEVVEAFIAKYPFAFITAVDLNNHPIATQIPMFLEKDGDRQFLRGHIMKNTDHHKAFEANENVLVVFSGHHTYVSGTWYSKPNTPSTWNYMSVHVKGKVNFVDTDGLISILRKTSLHFEDNNEASATAYDNIPDKTKDRIMHMIVGFEIEISDIDTVFKLSQDRDFESYINIIEKLKLQDLSGKVIASEMLKRVKEVFPEQG